MKKYKIWFCSLILALGFIIGIEFNKYLGSEIILSSGLLLILLDKINKQTKGEGE